MSQQNRLGTHKTTVKTEDGLTKIRYWNTDVVSFNNKMIFLDNGGFMTNTTKTRMNQTSNQFGLGFRVYQKDFEWYVDFDNKTYDFLNNMILLLQRKSVTTEQQQVKDSGRF